ncbi:unnamed protein product (plasmid) [Mycetohabitans rhizoxinica HKI 454]|uniref:Uncharacterized protein n=1 Tax=Mycetohabitans rhizoxinica (strain DSM 19002 / CIP 109453 / HKI 454) TaxID=882378 RepID=E5AVN4_MYCRK|nr:unnamed protein product [Mycetohabitans rhizoxinica HKI 454]
MHIAVTTHVSNMSAQAHEQRRRAATPGKETTPCQAPFRQSVSSPILHPAAIFVA